MENQIKNIELINNYLNKTLSEKETKDFEDRLSNEADFKILFEEHTIVVEGLKRQQLKKDILKGKKVFVRNKWLRYIGFVAIAGVILVLVYMKFIQSEVNSDNMFTTTVEYSVDSIASVSAIKDNFELVEPIQENEVLEIALDTAVSVQGGAKEEFLKSNEKVGEFKKKAQSFKFRANKDTTFICEEGTKITVMANTFVNANNNEVKGNVNLRVTEYYRLSDILLASLSTKSDENLLETGGMLHIEVVKNKQDLKLKKGKQIEIVFPVKNRKNGMQLFTGEWVDGNINWKLQDEITNQVVDEVEINSIEEQIEVPFSIVETPPAYLGCKSLDKVLAKKCTSDAISKFVQRKFNTEIADMLGLTGRQRISVIFKINQKGKVVNIRARSANKELEEEAIRVISLLPKMEAGKQRGKAVTVPYSLPIIFTVDGNVNTGNSSFSFKKIVYDTVYKQSRGQVERIREVMHDKDFKVDSAFVKTWETYTNSNLIRFTGSNKVILRKPLFELTDTRFKVLDDDSISRGGHVIRKLWDETKIPTTSTSMMLKPRQNVNIGNEVVTEKEFVKRVESKTDTTIKTGSVNTYVLRVSGLGWINCDRFVRRSNRIKYRFKVKDAYDAKVSMVFKSINSILPSRRFGSVYDFKMVPKNEEVILVAIKKQEGKLYFDILETKTLEKPNIEFEFKEVGLEELKKEIDKIPY